MVTIVTKSRKPVMSHEGCLYRFDRLSADDGKFWRCLQDGCQGYIKTDANDVFLEFRNSSHKCKEARIKHLRLCYTTSRH